MRIKDLVVRERPRERLHANGAAALSEAELLAILLRNGRRGESAVLLAQRLLARFTLEGLSTTPVQELCTIPGVGLAKASQVSAAFELFRRVQRRDPEKITTASQAFAYCQPRIGHLEQEHFLVVWLDARNHVLGDEIVTKGLVDTSLLEAFRSLLDEDKAAFSDQCQ